MKTSLSPKDLAAAVGVSESSLKRWADEGRLTVTRTAGGHRRIPIAEAVRFAREARMPILRPDILGLPQLAATKPITNRQAPDIALHEKLVEGDAAGVQAILLGLYLGGRCVAAIGDGPIHAAMTRIGERWRHGVEGIYIEHRATDICIQAVSILRSLIARPPEPGALSPDQDTRPVALGGGPAHDPYILPSLLCAAVLDEVGLRAINLGPDTPADVLLAAADRHQPRLVWLTCSCDEAKPDDAALGKLAHDIAKRHATLVIGGRAFEAADQTPPDPAVYCQTLGELEKYTRGLAAKR